MGNNRTIRIIAVLSLCLSLCGCLSTVRSPAQSSIPTAPPETTATPTTRPEVTLPNHIEVYREGERSLIPVETVRGTVGDYLIAIDPEYFTFSPQETVDMFSCSTWDGDMGVYFCIYAYGTEDPQQFLDDVIGQYDGQYRAVNVEDTTIGNYKATAVYLQGFRDDPNYDKHLFLIRCGQENYILEAQFVTEMYEGLYAIMGAIFDTFTVIDN